MTAIAVADDGLHVLAALPADYDSDYLGDNQIAELFAFLLAMLVDCAARHLFLADQLLP